MLFLSFVSAIGIIARYKPYACDVDVYRSFPSSLEFCHLGAMLLRPKAAIILHVYGLTFFAP